MTARSGESATSCVKIVLKHTSAVVWMDTSWSKITSAKLMCQVPPICVMIIVCRSRETMQTIQESAFQMLHKVFYFHKSEVLKAHFNHKVKFHHCISGGLPQLIFTNGGDLMMADIHGRFVRTLVPSQGKGNAVSVAYLFKSNIIFWSDTLTEKVGQ